MIRKCWTRAIGYHYWQPLSIPGSGGPLKLTALTWFMPFTRGLDFHTPMHHLRSFTPASKGSGGSSSRSREILWFGVGMLASWCDPRITSFSAFCVLVPGPMIIKLHIGKNGAGQGSTVTLRVTISIDKFCAVFCR